MGKMKVTGVSAKQAAALEPSSLLIRNEAEC